MTRHENMLSRREMIGIGLAAGLAGCSLPDAKLNHSSADIKTNSSENKQESELVIDNLTTVKGPTK
jgi:hypothetical protein